MVHYLTYSPGELTRQKNLLEDRYENGQTRDYRIHVDGIEVVPRTDDPTEFDRYERYVNENTKSITLTLYHNSSRNGDKLIYRTGNDPQADAGLGGVEVQQLIQKAIADERQQVEMQNLKSENEDLRDQVKQLEEVNADYEELLEEYKSRKHHIGNIDLGKLFSATLDGMLKRNPKLATKVPVIGAALAGAYEPTPDDVPATNEADNVADENVTVEAQAQPSEMTPQEEEAVQFLMQLKGYFTEADQPRVLTILSLLADKPENIPAVLELLQGDTEQNPKTPEA